MWMNSWEAGDCSVLNVLINTLSVLLVYFGDQQTFAFFAWFLNEIYNLLRHILNVLLYDMHPWNLKRSDFQYVLVQILLIVLFLDQIVHQLRIYVLCLLAVVQHWHYLIVPLSLGGSPGMKTKSLPTRECEKLTIIHIHLRSHKIPISGEMPCQIVHWVPSDLDSHIVPRHARLSSGIYAAHLKISRKINISNS
jgi:hypothetical protein